MSEGFAKKIQRLIFAISRPSLGDRRKEFLHKSFFILHYPELGEGERERGGREGGRGREEIKIKAL